MPSEFFTRLVEARREGSAPGMTPPEEESRERPELRPLTPEDGPPHVCTACGAVVVPSEAPRHLAWHGREPV